MSQMLELPLDRKGIGIGQQGTLALGGRTQSVERISDANVQVQIYARWGLAGKSQATWQMIAPMHRSLSAVLLLGHRLRWLSLAYVALERGKKTLTHRLPLRLLRP